MPPGLILEHPVSGTMFERGAKFTAHLLATGHSDNERFRQIHLYQINA